jgi:hypothetical protein
MKKVWLLENEQARWFEFEEPHDMPDDVTVTMLTEKEQPAQRTWVGLTDEEIDNLRDETEGLSPLIRAVEAKLKEKNT